MVTKTKATQVNKAEKMGLALSEFGKIMRSTIELLDEANKMYKFGERDGLFKQQLMYAYAENARAGRELDRVKKRIDAKTSYFLNYTVKRIGGTLVNYFSTDDIAVKKNKRGDFEDCYSVIVEHAVRTGFIRKDGFKKRFGYDCNSSAHFAGWAIPRDKRPAGLDDDYDYKRTYKIMK